jgi:hypothetical protein
LGNITDISDDIDTCIGYNSLYTVNIDGEVINNGNGRPDGKRIWCWIVLCNDGMKPSTPWDIYPNSTLIGTIISMQENPFPGPYQPTPEEEKTVVGTVRRNIVSIFSGVSKQHSADSDSESLVTVRVRHFSDSEADEASINQDDGSSLILYYIFDDWVSGYRLVARREHMYGATLDNIVSIRQLTFIT